MPFQVKDKTERFKLPAFPGVPNVFFSRSYASHINAVCAYFKPDDLIGTERKDVADPIVGAWFRMEKGPESTPPTYEYDEFGVVIDGI